MACWMKKYECHGLMVYSMKHIQKWHPFWQLVGRSLLNGDSASACWVTCYIMCNTLSCMACCTGVLHGVSTQRLASEHYVYGVLDGMLEHNSASEHYVGWHYVNTTLHGRAGLRVLDGVRQHGVLHGMLHWRVGWHYVMA